MKYQPGFLKIFMPASCALTILILLYELIGRYLSGIELNLPRILISAIGFSVLFNSMATLYLLRIYTLQINEDFFLWRSLLGKFNKICKSEIKKISHLKYFFNTLEFIEVRTNKNRVLIPLFFYNGDEVQSQIRKLEEK